MSTRASMYVDSCQRALYLVQWCPWADTFPSFSNSSILRVCIFTYLYCVSMNISQLHLVIKLCNDVILINVFVKKVVGKQVQGLVCSCYKFNGNFYEPGKFHMFAVPFPDFLPSLEMESKFMTSDAFFPTGGRGSRKVFLFSSVFGSFQ